MEKAGRESISLGQIIFILLLFLAIVGLAVTMFTTLLGRVNDYVDERNSQIEITALNSFYDLDCQEHILVTRVINVLQENGSMVDCIVFNGTIYATANANVVNATIVDSPAETVVPLLLNYTDKRCLVHFDVLSGCNTLSIVDLKEVQ